MSKFNSTPQSRSPRTVSKEGVSAFKPSAYQELCDCVLSCFFGEDKAYESGSQASNELIKLVRKVGAKDPAFIAKLTVLAREEFNLRSVAHVLSAELSKIHKGDDLVSRVISRVSKRPDDMQETLAYLLSSAQVDVGLNNRKRHLNKAIPNQVKKGLASAFTKFDEYQLSKYNSAKREVKLIDILRLTHPKPIDESQSELWGRLKNNTLKQATTWERELTKAGQNAEGDVQEEKQKAWETLIMEEKLPFMAALRNIRNIMKAGVSREAHTKLQSYLSNEKAVLNSKQLPFRFYSAWKAIQEVADPFLVKEYKKVLSKALFYSAKNVKKLEGRTFICTDLSGSMTMGTTSKNSDMNYKEIGAVMSVLANQFSDNAIISVFATGFGLVNISGQPESTLEDVEKILKMNIGHGTDAHLIFKYLNENKVDVDNIIIFSDMQFNGQYSDNWRYRSEKTADKDVTAYRKNVNSEAYLYEVNLAGYGSTQIDPANKKNIFMSGWSDASLKYIAEYQELRNGIVDMVKAVEL